MEPSLSIIIPTLNRELKLRDCVSSIRRHYQRELPLEVIVVNDGGRRPALEGLESAAFPLRVLDQENQGPGPSRNHGARNAKMSHLAFIDDDCRLTPGWFGALIEAISLDDHSLFVGPVDNALREDVYAQSSQDIITFLMHYFNRPDSGTAFFTTNFVVPSQVFQKTGGFDPAFYLYAEDRDLSRRLFQAGYSLTYLEDMKIDHFHHSSFKKFWFQHFRYGRGACIFHQQERMRSGVGLKVHWRFYWNLFVFRNGRSLVEQCRYGLHVLVSQLANSLGYIFEKVGWARPPTVRQKQEIASAV